MKNKKQIHVKDPIDLEIKWQRLVAIMDEIDNAIQHIMKNEILNVFMIKFFDIGLKKIADAFEKRATELFKRI